MITSELLRKMPSGAEAQEDMLGWFGEEFLNGGGVLEVWDKFPNDAWKVWFLCHFLPEPALLSLSLKFAGQTFRMGAGGNRSLAAFSDNVTVDNVYAARRTAVAHGLADPFLTGGNAIHAAYMVNTPDCLVWPSANIVVCSCIIAGDSGFRERMEWCREALAAHIAE